jgi:hypothetical protein
MKVLHVNRHWIDLIDENGVRAWIPSRHYSAIHGKVPLQVIPHGLRYPHHRRVIRHVGAFVKIECSCGRSWMLDTP